MMKFVAFSTLILASFVAADLGNKRVLRMMKKKKSSKSKSAAEVECSTELNTCLCPVKRFVYDSTVGTQATHITRAASMGCQLATLNDSMEFAQGLAVLAAAGITVGSGANVWVGAVGSTAAGPPTTNRMGWYWYDTCGDGPLIDPSLWCTPTAEPDNGDFQARLNFGDTCEGRLAGGGSSYPALYECCVVQPEPPSKSSKSKSSNGGMMKKKSRRELRMMGKKKKSSKSKSVPVPAPVCEPLPLSGSAGINAGAVVPVFPPGMLPPVYECCD